MGWHNRSFVNPLISIYSQDPRVLTGNSMKYLEDKLLILLLGLLGITLMAYIYDIFPYPFGLLILLILIAARLFSQRSF